jgi:FKBP-type peptidyl-prolyl cis-trans isomerase FkpA
MLSEGDSATVKVNIDSMAKIGQPRPPGLKGKYIIFQIKVEKVIAKGNLSAGISRTVLPITLKGYLSRLKKLSRQKFKNILPIIT